jgi:hypothetical protein
MPSLECRGAVNFKYEKVVKKLLLALLYVLTRGSQRHVVYLGLPIAHSFISPNAGDGGGGSQPMGTAVHNAHGAQINFGNLTPYLTYGFDLLLVFTHAKTWPF